MKALSVNEAELRYQSDSATYWMGCAQEWAVQLELAARTSQLDVAELAVAGMRISFEAVAEALDRARRAA